MNTVAVIIPTFRRQEKLYTLLDGLARNTRLPDEIIVVDNDPNENPDLRRGCTERGARYIHLGRGLFLSGARNAGWRATTSDLCVFIDDDNIVPEDFIANYINAAQTYPDLGIIAPIIHDLSERNRVWYAGIRRSMWTTRTRFLYQEGGLPDRALWPTDDAPDVFAMPRHVLQHVDGFDEVHFPFHYDEADIGERVRVAGFKVAVVPTLTVTHAVTRIGVGTEFARAYTLCGEERIRLMMRGRIWFHRRHSRGLKRVVALGLFVPAYVAVVVLACAMAPAPLSVKTKAISAIPAGVIAGYCT